MKEKIQQILIDNTKTLDWYSKDNDYYDYSEGWNDALDEVGAMILKALDD